MWCWRTYVRAQGFYVLPTFTNNGAGVLEGRKEGREGEARSCQIPGWDESSNATRRSRVFTLLWSKMRSSTISSAFLERLKACSSSMSSAGRLPNGEDHPGRCYSFIRLRCFNSHKNTVRFNIVPTISKKKKPQKTADGTAPHSPPTIGGFIQQPTLFWIRSSTIM